MASQSIISPPITDDELFAYVNNDKATMKLLGQHKILSRNIKCPACDSNCALTKNSTPRDSEKYPIGYRLKCREESHHTYSYTKNSYLYNSKLSLSQHIKLLWYFFHEANVFQTEAITKISKKTIIKFNRIYRKCLSFGVNEYFEHNKLGTVDATEGDESAFNHKRKYHRGNKKGKTGWVMGIVERGTGRCFLVCVDDRKKKTLTEIIKKVVQEESTIITDQWKGYVSLGDEGYVHISINHSITFKDPLTGETSNTIEGLFSNAKKKFKQMNGIKREFTQEYLDEFTWRRLHSSLSPQQQFSRMLLAIAKHQHSVI